MKISKYTSSSFSFHQGRPFLSWLSRPQLLASLIVSVGLLEAACIPIGGSAPMWEPESSSSSESTDTSTDALPTSENSENTSTGTGSSDSASEGSNETITDSDTGSLCGNGELDEGEECDDANQSNEDACLVGCIDAECGDGYVHKSLEACDDGNDIDNDDCTNQCKLPNCGDGIVQVGEECDDGNQSNTDNCTNLCVSATCGDNYKQPGELCDDGNQVNTDFCTNECTTAKCGDGYKQPINSEECDDANDIDTDACTNACKNAKCGDGIVQVSQGEECDDANNDNNDDCTVECKEPACGDGYPQDGEECDDGDTDNLNACANSCTRTIKEIVPGEFHNCVLFKSGIVRCWGHNGSGQLGYGNETFIGDNPGEMPPANVPVGGTVKQLNTKYGHNCAALNSGAVKCWGRGGSGQLGYGASEDIGDDPNEMPPKDVSVGGTVNHFAIGAFHTCALLNSGPVRCWGHNGSGQLGYDNEIYIGNNPDEMPSDNLNLGAGTITQIASGHGHTCARGFDIGTGAVKCWGRGDFGQLGYNDANNLGDGKGAFMPPLIVATGFVSTQIAAGEHHTCALVKDLNNNLSVNVRCWGKNESGQLGYGNTINVGDGKGAMMPPKVVSVGGKVIQLAAGGDHTCVLLDSGDVKCWGANQYGQLGYGNTLNVGDNEVPSAKGNVDLEEPAVQVAPGRYHTCVLLKSGNVRCWGRGDYGQLGHGKTTNIGDNEVPKSIGFVSLF